MLTAILLLIGVGLASGIVSLINANRRARVRQQPPAFICAACGASTYADAAPGFGSRFAIAVLVAGAAWLSLNPWAALLLTVASIVGAFVLNEMHVTHASRVCDRCRSRRVVPLDSPIGSELARDYSSTTAA